MFIVSQIVIGVLFVYFLLHNHCWCYCPRTGLLAWHPLPSCCALLSNQHHPALAGSAQLHNCTTAQLYNCTSAQLYCQLYCLTIGVQPTPPLTGSAQLSQQPTTVPPLQLYLHNYTILHILTRTSHWILGKCIYTFLSCFDIFPFFGRMI